MLSNVDDVLAHAGVYDPVARRERYLRERQLKGKQPGRSDADGQERSGSGSQVTGGNRKSKPALQGKVNQAQSAARQAAALRARLTVLRAALQKLLAEAKSSSSSTSTSSSSSKKGGGSSSKSEPKTAKQKAAAEKALEKAREERKKTTPEKKESEKKEPPSKEEQIAHLRSVIKDVEAKLRAVLERARPQTASNGR